MLHVTEGKTSVFYPHLMKCLESSFLFFDLEKSCKNVCVALAMPGVTMFLKWIPDKEGGWVESGCILATWEQIGRPEPEGWVLWPLFSDVITRS